MTRKSKNLTSEPAVSTMLVEPIVYASATQGAEGFDLTSLREKLLGRTFHTKKGKEVAFWAEKKSSEPIDCAYDALHGEIKNKLPELNQAMRDFWNEECLFLRLSNDTQNALVGTKGLIWWKKKKDRATCAQYLHGYLIVFPTGVGYVIHQLAWLPEKGDGLDAAVKFLDAARHSRESEYWLTQGSLNQKTDELGTIDVYQKVSGRLTAEAESERELGSLYGLSGFIGWVPGDLAWEEHQDETRPIALPLAPHIGIGPSCS